MMKALQACAIGEAKTKSLQRASRGVHERRAMAEIVAAWATA